MQAKIVLLTETLSVTSQIVADDIPQIAKGGYRTLINNRPDDEEPGQLSSAEARREAEALGIAYHYLPFTAASLTTHEVDAFDKLMTRIDGPVLAHCRSGTRCYLLWAASELRKGKASADDLISQAAGQGFDISALRRFA